jgi:dihydropteroate synthase
MTWQQFETWLGTVRSDRRPLVMGILNVTPDSFSDGGHHSTADTAAAHAVEMVEAGADLLDIGGESTRPGALRVDANEQLRRVMPVIERLRDLPAVVSIDTTRAVVARAAVEAGAKLVNDVSGGLDDPAMLPTVAAMGAPIVLMHMRGNPQTMQSLARYADVTAEVREHLRQRRDAAVAAGIRPDRIILDPGIGFAKTADHDLILLRQLAELRELGHPLLLGTSRKKFIGRITGDDLPADRVFGTAATVAWGVANGADIVRVHDVAAMVKVVRMIRAIVESGGAGNGPA